MTIREIPKEEAVHRILEADHAEPEMDDQLVNSALIDFLNAGIIKAGIDEETGKLCFMRMK